MAIKLGDAVLYLDADSSALTQSLSKASKAAGMAAMAIGGGVVAALGTAVAAGIEFEQAIANAASVTGRTGDEFTAAKGKLSELAMTLGETTVFSASEAAGALYDLASKGFDVVSMSAEEVQPILDLAAATQDDLGHATETVTSTLRGFGLENQDTARIADVFAKAIGSSAATMDKLQTSMTYVAPVARAAGVSLEQTTAILGELYNAGMDGSMAGTSLRNVLTEMISPSDKMLGVLKRLKVSTKTWTDSSISATDKIKLLRDAGFTAADAMDVLGKRGGPAFITLLAGAENAQELGAALEKAGGTAQEMADLQLDTLGGRLKLIGSQLEGLQLRIYDALEPALTKLAELFSEIIGVVLKWIRENPELVRHLAEAAAIFGVVTLAAGALLVGLGALATFMSPLAAIILGVVVVVGLLAAAFKDDLIAAGTSLVAWSKAAWPTIQKIFETGWQLLQPLLDVIRDIIRDLVNWLAQQFMNLAHWAYAHKETIIEVTKNIISTVSGFLRMLEQIIRLAWIAISTVIGGIWVSLFGDMDDLDQRLIDSTASFSDFTNGIADKLTTLNNFLTETLPEIKDNVKDFFDVMTLNLRTYLKVVNAVIGAIIDFLFWVGKMGQREAITDRDVNTYAMEQYVRANEHRREMEEVAERAREAREGGESGSKNISINVASMNVTSESDVQKVAKALHNITVDAQFAASYSGV